MHLLATRAILLLAIHRCDSFKACSEDVEIPLNFPVNSQNHDHIYSPSLCYLVQKYL